MRSQATINALDDPKSVQCSAHNFIEFFGSNQKPLSLKMAEILKFFCKKLVCYQNAKFHQPKVEKSFFIL